MKYIILIIFSLFFVSSFGQTKYFTPRIKVIDSAVDSTRVAKTEGTHFRVISKIKQVDLKDAGKRVNGNGQIISIDGDLLKFSTHNKAFDIKEKAFEEDESGDAYYSFVYFDKRRKYYATVLFDDNDDCIILINDEKGNGYLYNVEVI